MKLRIKIDSEELLPSLFSPGAIERIESVFEKELLFLCEKFENYAEAEVSLSFLDSAEIRDVNKQYRGIDEPTDVLSFLLWREEECCVLPSVGILPLGDIVICPEEAEREHKPMERVEALSLVLAHGFLHLLGWDHDTPEKEEVMWKRQELLKFKLQNALEEVF